MYYTCAQHVKSSIYRFWNWFKLSVRFFYAKTPFEPWCNLCAFLESTGEISKDTWYESSSHVISRDTYQCRKSHCGDKTTLRPSYLHNGISFTIYIESGPRLCLKYVGPLHEILLNIFWKESCDMPCRVKFSYKIGRTYLFRVYFIRTSYKRFKP